MIHTSHRFQFNQPRMRKTQPVKFSSPWGRGEFHCVDKRNFETEIVRSFHNVKLRPPKKTRLSNLLRCKDERTFFSPTMALSRPHGSCHTVHIQCSRKGIGAWHENYIHAATTNATTTPRFRMGFWYPERPDISVSLSDQSRFSTFSVSAKILKRYQRTRTVYKLNISGP